MKPIRILVLLTCACTVVASGNAQSIRNAGSTGAQFLKIGVGARAMGMGGAFGAVTGDATTLAWNPAGIGTIEAVELSVQHTSWVAGIQHNFIGLAVPITDQFTLGFHTIYLTSGNIEITTIDQPEGTGRFYSASDIVVGLTSSIRLTTQLTFATTVKIIQERIHDVEAMGLALDAGAWYETGFRSLQLGFSLSHLGLDQAFSGKPLEVRYEPPAPGEPPVRAELQASRFPLPLMFRAGGSFDVFTMFADPVPDHRFVAALDFIQHSDTPERVVVGAEYTWQNTVSLRTGYLFNADELGWSFGAGVSVPVSEMNIRFDYAASSLGRFGYGHRVGLVVGYR